jgi:KaiC/GvpD/RAD55 family RecA-like ATPase
VKTANAFIEDAKSRPIPKRLIGDLVFQGELTLFFGDAGSGKSILGVQACDDISAAKQSLGLDCESDGLKTLFCDLELSDKQFENRYSENYENHYQFSDNFLRAEFNRNCVLPENLDFERYVFQSIEAEVAEKGIEVLIIDNKTALKAATEKSHDAGHFMNELNRIKQKYSLTIILICHTPKRDASRPISSNDLAGSKVLYNLADACFAIGVSHADQSIRYVKQLKVRSAGETLGESNVMLYRVGKPSNFLGLDYLGTGVERDHLAQTVATDQGGRRQHEACEFLQQELKDGPVNLQKVKQKAEEVGIASGTLRRAREALGVETKWGEWSLPNAK